MAALSPAQRHRGVCCGQALIQLALVATSHAVADFAVHHGVQEDLEVFADPSCFDGKGRTPEKCCGHVPHAGPCLWGNLLSDGYCCNLSSECFAWGVFIDGDDARDPMPARTGLECRHLCQAEPKCQAWSFVLATIPAEELRFSCWLKTRLWSSGEALRRQRGVVSGSRHCPGVHADTLHQLQALRTMDLRQEPDAAVVRPSLDPEGYAQRAAESILRRGWAVVRGALGAEEAEELMAASHRAMEDLLDRDPERVGNRGPRRYSLGSASKTHHMAHVPEWARLIDNPVITPILRLVFQDAGEQNGTDDYVAIGGGGDVVLGQTDSLQWQWLHVDLPRWEIYDRIHPPPGIGVNFAVHDVSCQGGAMRLIPGTHVMPYLMHKMAPHTETAMLEEMGLSRVFACPLQRGDVLLRDLRLWHAGSANLETEVRHSPNAEFLAPWYAKLTKGTSDHLAPREAIPKNVWEGLSLHGQHVSMSARAEGDLDTGFHQKIIVPQQFD
ncbi:unnamed protein product [Polarella glacialis]|uniref:Apple domain-containing protein n=1 Tax=Polarella glacialis TaxID=89957 RepID=A0A813GN19_POLGL|nr:unnamed protein product [Polarella glacialis]